MSNFLTLHDSSEERVNNRPYYRGTWETIKMEKNRMIPFQVKADGSPLEVIQYINSSDYNVTGKLAGLTSQHSDYITYSGGFFTDYLTTGRCYMKINDKYTDDIDVLDINKETDLLGSELLTGWINNNYDTFSATGSTINAAVSSGTYRLAYSNDNFTLTKGQKLKIVAFASSMSGVTHYLRIRKQPWASPAYQSFVLVAGWNYFTYDCEVNDVHKLYLETNGSGGIKLTSMSVKRKLFNIETDWSEDYVKIMVSSGIDFGGTYYKGGFFQVLWKEGTVEKGQGAAIEVIGEERNGVIVKEKITTATKYRVKLKVTEPEYTALVQALPADWTITDINGKVYTCNNLEISDPDWYNGNGIVTLTFTDNISVYAQNNDDL